MIRRIAVSGKIESTHEGERMAAMCGQREECRTSLDGVQLKNGYGSIVQSDVTAVVTIAIRYCRYCVVCEAV